MDNLNNHSNSNPSSWNNEGKDFHNQLKRINAFLKKHTVSRYMVSIYLGIPIQSVTRRVAMLKESGRLAVIRIDKCKISGRWVEFVSTDADKFPEDNQINLF